MKIHRKSPGAAALLLALSGSASAGLVFDLDVGQDGSYDSDLNLEVDDLAWVDLYVSGIPDLGNGEGLISWGFDLVYDTASLEVTTAVGGSNWDDLGAAFTLTNLISLSPTLKMTGGSWNTAFTGDHILLASFQVKGLAAGTSTLTLFDSDHGGSYDDFVMQNPNDLTSPTTALDTHATYGLPPNGVELATSSVEAPLGGGQVPLPTPLALLAPGLLGWFMAGRGTKKQLQELQA